ncbi:CBS domain-containing protein [Tetragenococcus koreensis]|uniref:DRTGG domain-containing protein n=1 Tax=Tetragenococcus koreensis TaxID=290335 RepID=UPI001EE9D175|nr:DRTGG domain-containing protein [Tetragenococcus koreensis]MCF1584810.1 CBS domain-containing protein [Tetragenococcus koreensis]MCF1614571.1 CBS domain-containing protein [Tetragenococcus koreensis]MCF1616710.1 CBS domain-containing protein [Tetragenococcus koreensis]MCF1619957.1 CBS domain-containing protein [Tetragenococcus koreensis]MCF1621592.1 CBS domain-containing protein [Tetragenococcus koreensis]
MATKHDLILAHIEGLQVGERISVRGIAKSLDVSEGTAYRAIKDAENSGLVSTIQRVGTIRIERKLKKHIEQLTFGEVVQIIEGDVLGGSNGLQKDLNKFVIGAMTEEAMQRYITPGSLMIVGNRLDAQKLALQGGAAVLITGGFDTSPEIRELADHLELPILRTTYDTFTVASMINRAMSDQLIKKDILLVGDIYMPLEKTRYLTTTDTIKDYQTLSNSSQHSRYPVVNKNTRVVGIVTAKDVIGKPDSQSIERVMTKGPRMVKKEMSVASVSHQMIWDGLEVMPVVADDLSLLGIVTRQDVMKAMQLVQRQPQVTDTISDQITGDIQSIEEDLEGNKLPAPQFSFVVTPQMVDELGTISIGVLNEVIANVTKRTMVANNRRNAWIEQVNLHYFRLIQLESELNLQPQVLELGRRSAKLDVDVFIENSLVAKAIVVCQVMERP